jgi:segregation and condensation protein A
MSRAPVVATLLPESWRVQLPIFEGPLDLLLQLIKVNEVEITDIPVAVICDQFHEYLRLMDELNLDVAGEYIYEAALLIHLKSKMLLPQPSGLDGESVADDPRQELVERLLEYRRIKEVAQSMAEVDRLRQGIWTRRSPGLDLDEGAEIDLGEVSLYDLLGALKEALDRFEREHPPPYHLDRETYSVEAQIQRLLARMSPARPFDLIDDLQHRSCRAEVVAAFLAVLELARLQLARIHQTEGGEILLYRTTRDPAPEAFEAVEG